jgi:pilus assembly protein Flp/PilA
MSKYLQAAKNLIKDEEGAALIEYTVLLGILLVAVILVIGGVGTWINNEWTKLCSSLTTGTACTPTA